MMSRLQSREAHDPEVAEEDERQYGHGPLSKEEMDAKYPNRPHNHSKTFPFHQLFTSLFNPLNENKKQPTGPKIARAKQGRHGPSKLNAHDAREAIIERFFSRWRSDVGDDIYPALRLIIPEKDRERPMYGLKEKAIGKLLVKVLKIDKNSDDATNLLNWKLPGQTSTAGNTGDFAGRCFEVLSKRPMRVDVGDMRIAEVNELLDKLSAAQKEEQQLPLFHIFYTRMNAEELTWLVRIILRQMKIGASEKTILNLWHPDGEALFNISSSLRRVAWELKDKSFRLERENGSRIELMSCFQPQLAAFQKMTFQQMVDAMNPREDDSEFWIEEKLDGERMQMHMIEDPEMAGGFRFAFWSRKAKDYTYLYGNGLQDKNSALTQHMGGVFDSGVRNLILDGEMITWDPELDVPVSFGTLKTAALSEQRNPFAGTGQRPLFRVFDILYLNDKDLTPYTLRDRRAALDASVIDVYRRIEKHGYSSATAAEDIEPQLRKVVEGGLEGLVLKSPRSMYRLSERTNDWTKVKPEYMTGFGESFDCVIIGGYYGSGHRGGRLSSFLCGLKVGKNLIQQGANPEKCWSFFKVGGGFRLEDYERVRHHTEGKWVQYDPQHPPLEYLELAGKDFAQYERPDVWIKPSDSLVVEVKAASIGATQQFRTGSTLRFPRFKRLRTDKSWFNALDFDEFNLLRKNVEEESKSKEFKVENRRATKRLKKQIEIAGDNELASPYAGPATKIFDNLNFCVLSESLKPKLSKADLEQMVKANGGKIFQNPVAKDEIIIIADKKVVKVASLIKRGQHSIIRPNWIIDTIAQAELDYGRSNFLLPFESKHMFSTIDENQKEVESHVDQFGDSYARDVSVDELNRLLLAMTSTKTATPDVEAFLNGLERHGRDVTDLKGQMFRRLRIYLADPEDIQMYLAGNTVQFGNGTLISKIEDKSVTHIVTPRNYTAVKLLRQSIASRQRVPRIVTVDWIEESWREGTLLDDEEYVLYGT